MAVVDGCVVVSVVVVDMVFDVFLLSPIEAYVMFLSEDMLWIVDNSWVILTGQSGHVLEAEKAQRDTGQIEEMGEMLFFQRRLVVSWLSGQVPHT